MKGRIVKGPSREELAKAMFHDGLRVSFTIDALDEGGARREVVVMAKITGAESDGTYHAGQRNGMMLKGNCYHGLDVPGSRERFECLYNLSATEPNPADPGLGSFRSGRDLNTDCEVCGGPCIGADA